MEQNIKEYAAASAVNSSGIVFPGIFRNFDGWVFGIMPGVKIIPIVGMAGIGNTTLAKQIFQHPTNRASFECFAWVTVGQYCEQEQIAGSILR
ncbi:hypothetical protein ACS0TY_007101 [Phlomoides rotata]